MACFPDQARPRGGSDRVDGAPSIAHRLRSLGWRARLVVVIATCAGLGFALGDPQPRAAADPELARLLRGMALVKAMIILGVVRLLWWRLGRPVMPAFAAGYVAAAGAMATAAALAWQLSLLALLSIAFHGALLSLAVLALRDDDVRVPGPPR